MATLTDCIESNGTYKTSEDATHQGCYRLAITQKDNITPQTKWTLQDGAVQESKASGLTLTTDENAKDKELPAGITSIKTDCGSDTQCLTDTQWRNIKLLKAFTDNYQSWKDQEDKAIRQEIDTYQQRVTAVTGRVNNMLASLDKIEARQGNTAKQEHMLSELSNMLSTYDRRLDTEQKDSEQTDKRFNTYKTLTIGVFLAIVVCAVLLYYLFQKKRN